MLSPGRGSLSNAHGEWVEGNRPSGRQPAAPKQSLSTPLSVSRRPRREHHRRGPLRLLLVEPPVFVLVDVVEDREDDLADGCAGGAVSELGDDILGLRPADEAVQVDVHPRTDEQADLPHRHSVGEERPELQLPEIQDPVPGDVGLIIQLADLLPNVGVLHSVHGESPPDDGVAEAHRVLLEIQVAAAVCVERRHQRLRLVPPELLLLGEPLHLHLRRGDGPGSVQLREHEKFTELHLRGVEQPGVVDVASVVEPLGGPVNDLAHVPVLHPHLVERHLRRQHEFLLVNGAAAVGVHLSEPDGRVHRAPKRR
mmetsp:Transcript_81157/g.227542  ORF Transcript_81157/g.227542 Transcript_81157/m.227542 type:complete len:311 (-) Transcript_81157:273-1205(-)